MDSFLKLLCTLQEKTLISNNKFKLYTMFLFCSMITSKLYVAIIMMATLIHFSNRLILAIWCVCLSWEDVFFYKLPTSSFWNCVNSFALISSIPPLCWFPWYVIALAWKTCMIGVCNCYLINWLCGRFGEERELHSTCNSWRVLLVTYICRVLNFVWLLSSTWYCMSLSWMSMIQCMLRKLTYGSYFSLSHMHRCSSHLFRIKGRVVKLKLECTIQQQVHV